MSPLNISTIHFPDEPNIMSLRIQIAEFFRHTKGMAIYRDELSHTQFLSHGKLEEIQWRRLERLLKHAYDQVPYYRRIFDERALKPADIQCLADLKLMPTLTKEDIRANYEDILAKDAKQHRPRRVSSGGSTGDPLSFYIDAQTNSYQWADVYRGKIRGGWIPGEPVGKVYGTAVLAVHNPFKQKAYAWANNWRLFPAFKSGEDDMRRWIQYIRKHHIRILSGYVDVIVSLARFAVSENLQTPLVAVFPTTAPLTLSGRRLIEKAFGCGVFDLYQSTDGGLSATECHQHAGLHIAEERCLVETATPSIEQDVSVVVTDLFNYAMPFIRYENGDELTISGEICPCGRGQKLITHVRGKTYHQILLPDGQQVHSEIISYHFRHLLIVKHFRAVQTSLADITIELVLDERYGNEKPQLEDALHRLPNSLPGIKISEQYTDEIKRLPNQKFEIFVPYKNTSSERSVKS